MRPIEKLKKRQTDNKKRKNEKEGLKKRESITRKT